MIAEYSPTQNSKGSSWAEAGGLAWGWVGPRRPAWPGPPFLCHHRPRPGPVDPLLIRWAAARPGTSTFRSIGRGPARPTIFQSMGPGPAKPITFEKNHGPTWPDPSFFQTCRQGPAQPIACSEAHETLDSIEAGPTITCAGRGFDGSDNMLLRTKTCMLTLSLTLSVGSHSVGQLLSSHETHKSVTTTDTILLHQLLRWLLVGHHLVLLQRPQQQ